MKTVITRVFLSMAMVCMMCGAASARSPQGPDDAHPLIIQGRYAGSQAGDFNYLLLDADGRQYSFFCDYMITTALEALKPEHDIAVEFVTKFNYVESAGQEIEMQIVRSVFAPDEYAPDRGVIIRVGDRP